MTTYTVRILDKKIVADHTLELTLEKPAGFDFTAGQFIQLRLPDSVTVEPKDRMRSLSIASAPCEDTLKIVMRVPEPPSAYKKALQDMQTGDTLEVRGPFGHFTLHEDLSRPAVFIAGGIGITPFRSMVLQEEHEKKGYVIRLLYSNRNVPATAYFDELRSADLPAYKLVCTMTQLGPAESEQIGCTTGYIDGPFITKYTGDLKKPVYYIVGLPAMVTTAREQLLQMGVPNEDIKIELYSGYK